MPESRASGNGQPAMRFRLRSVTQVLVGLQRVGLVGLERAIADAEESGLTDRDQLLDRIMADLERQNYVPASALEEYRRAVWREVQRRRGEDISDLYSRIPVVVRGQRGEELDRFVDMITSVFGEHELKPVPAFEPPDPVGPNPGLVIDGQTVVAGATREAQIRRAVRAQISDW